MSLAESAKSSAANHPLTTAITASSLMHVIGFSILFGITTAPLLRQNTGPIKVKINIEEPKAVPEALPAKPKTQPKPPPPKAETPPPAKPDEPPKQKIEPVQGLRPDALVDGPSRTVAPIGNTLMVEDEGKRLTEVEQMGADQTAGARLIQNSFIIPEYTQEALDANIEGSYVVDVYVDETGKVVDAQLRKKIGLGMDSPVLQSARSAKFIPRKNRQGGSIAGWAEIRFTLTIP